MNKQKESFHDFMISYPVQPNARSIISKFMKYKQGEVLAGEVDYNWLLRYSKYLEEKELSVNTQINYLGTMIFTLKAAKAVGYKFPLDFEELEKLKGKAGFKLTKEASESIYLNRDELKLIEQYKPKNTEERYSRAIFLISCYTGARVSDAIAMSENNFNGDEVNFTSIKTKSTSRIPLHPMVPELLEITKKFSYTTQDATTVVNRSIKKICFNVGIGSEKDIMLYNRGAFRKNPKWKEVSSHTARKSFATNMLLDGYEMIQICKMMGHEDVKQTGKYICTNIDDMVKGNRTYLRPHIDVNFDNFVKYINAGLDVVNTCVALSVSGVDANEIIRVKAKYESTR